MAYNFPKAGSKAADLVTPHTMMLLKNVSSIPLLKDARINAANWLKTSKTGATGLYSTCMLANDDIAIVFFGIRGAQRIVWNFGRA